MIDWISVHIRTTANMQRTTSEQHDKKMEVNTKFRALARKFGGVHIRDSGDATGFTVHTEFAGNGLPPLDIYIHYVLCGINDDQAVMTSIMQNNLQRHQFDTGDMTILPSTQIEGYDPVPIYEFEDDPSDALLLIESALREWSLIPRWFPSPVLFEEKWLTFPGGGGMMTDHVVDFNLFSEIPVSN